jgi:hypothetical protein
MNEEWNIKSLPKMERESLDPEVKPFIPKNLKMTKTYWFWYWYNLILILMGVFTVIGTFANIGIPGHFYLRIIGVVPVGLWLGFRGMKKEKAKVIDAYLKDNPT